MFPAIKKLALSLNLGSSRIYMRKLILTLLFINSFQATSKNISNEMKLMSAGQEVLTSLNISDAISLEVILDKTVRGNGTVLIGESLLKIKDSYSDDNWVYENEYLDIQLSDVNNDGISEIIVSGISKHYQDGKQSFKLNPIIFIYSYSTEDNSLIEIFRNSVVEIDLTK